MKKENHIEDDLKSEFLAKINNSKKIFQGLLESCNNNFAKGCGSYLFDGTNYEYCEKMLEKQLLLYKLSKENNSVLEIGTYMSHSLLIMLLANPNMEITCIDIDKSFTEPTVNYLIKKLNAKINFIHGNSLDILPNINKKFDLFHIDGAHELSIVSKEFELCKKLSSSEFMKVVFDDYEGIVGINEIISKNHKIIEQVIPKSSWTNSYIKIKI